uniref:Uncharacterized protein n=1 Tax=Cacopsylla melanoneura TaxID=428564 RepID=A0A8D9BKE7_9HEMI
MSFTSSLFWLLIISEVSAILFLIAFLYACVRRGSFLRMSVFHLIVLALFFLGTVESFSLIFDFTRKWSESQFGPLQLLMSDIDEKWRDDTRTWSICVTSFVPHCFHVPRCMSLC